ncbi:MAG: adenylate/guanylate cyclase domain-containing protein [Aliishimia sp.]
MNKLRKERIEPLIDSHRGRIFKLMGDGILVEFASVVDAVNCAAAWQISSGEEDLCFRIGINLGDVMVEDGDMFGNGVNVAARLEALADPGGICLSGIVHDEVRAKLKFSFEDMGSQTVKNLTEPVRAYRVLLETPLQTEKPRSAPQTSGKLGVAVLPLNNMSSDTA